MTDSSRRTVLATGAAAVAATTAARHGENSTEAKGVKAGWNAVGLLL